MTGVKFQANFANKVATMIIKINFTDSKKS